MVRGSKLLVLLLIVMFLASAFLIPNHMPAQTNGKSPSVSNISSTRTVAAFTPQSLFVPVSYGITFSEAGLPSGTSWTVSVGLNNYSSHNSSMLVSLPAGSYAYTVSNSPGYFTSSPSGNFNLQGNGQIISVNYLGKYTVNSYVNLETGATVSSFPSLSTSQSVFPVYGLYDSYSNVYLVAGFSSSILYEINPVNFAIVGEIPVPVSPIAAAVNPANGIIYVLTVSELIEMDPFGGTLAIVQLPTSPAAMAFDPANGQVLVSGSYGGIFAYNGSSLNPETILSSINEFDTQGFAYNSALGQMEIVDNSGSSGYIVYLNGNDQIVSSLPTPGTLLSLVYDRTLNISMVSAMPGNTPYVYTVSQSGLTLVSGTANCYGLGINYAAGTGIATDPQDSTTLLMNLSTGSVVYTINTPGAPIMPLSASGSPGMLVIDPNYDALDVIPLGGEVRDVNFTEHGISPLQKWGVSVNGYTISSATDSLVFYEPTGLYSYTPLAVPGYTTITGTGAFTVDNSNVAVDVQYNRTYNVSFLESGLQAGVDWEITVNGSSVSGTSGNPLIFPEINGTYAFAVENISGYAVSPQNGLFTVSGSNVTILLNFSMTGYLATFISNGLPLSSQWGITINGVLHIVNSPVFHYVVTPGNYSYKIEPLPGFYPEVPNGSFTVTDHNLTLNITWLPYLYHVEFTENSLPSGTSWTVNLSSGLLFQSNTTNISAYLQNGTYAYTFQSLNSSWKGSHGSVTVDGSGAVVQVNFTEVLYSVVFKENGLPLGADWTVSINSLNGGTTFSSITFSLPNGTYAFSAFAANKSYSPVSGSITVDGAPAAQNVTFMLRNASVTFHETGLLNGTEWGIEILQAGTYMSYHSNITVTLPLGVYSYIPVSIPGYNSTNISSVFDLGTSAENLTIDVTYSPIPTISQLYNVTVSEVGLPDGLLWAVSYNGTIIPAFPGGIFNFNLENGSYNLTFMSLDHKGMIMPGSFTADVQVNGTSQYLLVLFYGTHVWMVFDIPTNGGGHYHNHDDHQYHEDGNYNYSTPETSRQWLKLM